MYRLLLAVVVLAFASVADAQPKKKREFRVNDTGTPGQNRGVSESKIRPNRTHAAMKFTVVDKDKGPIPGIVISLTAPDGRKFYTEETDAKGYAEVLVPNGRKYELVYLSLGRKDIAATIPVNDKPNNTVRLTLRYKKYIPPKGPRGKLPHIFVLKGIEFDTGKATIRKSSYSRLDRIVEYLAHKKSARIQISGHTDNVGSAKGNKKLSQRRADACRKYVIKKGIAADRVEAIGYGDERPVAPNDTEEGRQKNRRIEAIEL